MGTTLGTTTSSRHHYFLEVFVRNVGKRFTDWEDSDQVAHGPHGWNKHGIGTTNANAERSTSSWWTGRLDHFDRTGDAQSPPWLHHRRQNLRTAE